MSEQLSGTFSTLPTPLIADACLRLEVSFRLAPFGIRPLTGANHIAGRVLPTRHYGSVDILLEALSRTSAGHVLVVDNKGQKDEACVGDLTILEAQACGASGVIVWGCHRDTDYLVQIGFPVFSYGCCPTGPQRLDPRDPDALEIAHFGDAIVSSKDVVFADTDGVLFVPQDRAEEILRIATAIHQTESKQAKAIREGKKLREQFELDEYLRKRADDSTYSFREHLRKIGGAMEE